MKTLVCALSICCLLLCVNCSKDPDPAPGVTEIGAPTGIKAFDIGNNESSADVRVFFTPGTNVSEVQEHRIFIAKNTAPDLTTEDALAAAADRYQLTSQSDAVVRLTLGAGVNDTDGDPLQNGGTYVVYVLAVPASQDLEAKLSAASSLFELENKELKDLYISSRSTNSVEAFDGVTYEYLGSFISSGLGGLSAPQEVIFLEDGTVLVTGRFNTAIKQYDATTGAFLGDFTSGYSLSEPTKTNIGPDGHLYVSQWSNDINSVVRFNLSTGAFIDEIIPSLKQGMDQAWDSQGNLFVVSFQLNELRKYSSNFVLQQTVKDQLLGPVNIWIDGADDIFVIDWSSGSVKKYSPSGDFDSVFISGMTRAEGFVMDSDGGVLICDWQDNQVNRYHVATGEFLGTVISSSKMENPNSITFGTNQDP